MTGAQRDSWPSVETTWTCPGSPLSAASSTFESVAQRDHGDLGSAQTGRTRTRLTLVQRVLHPWTE